MNETVSPVATDHRVAFARAMRALIDLNEARREDPEIAGLARGMPLTVFVQEFGTVHVDAGRGVGKSTFVADVAQAGDVIVVGNEPLARELRRQTVAVVLVARAPYALMDHGSWERAARAGAGQRRSRVFVDEPSMLPPAAIDSIYALAVARLSRERPPTFVLLGPAQSVGRRLQPVAARGSGRTTRMLEHARMLAASGRAVYILARDRPAALELDRQLGEGGRALGIKVETKESLGFGLMEWRRMRVPGMHPNCEVLVDHDAIEHEFSAMLEMLHRYDLQPGEEPSRS